MEMRILAVGDVVGDPGVRHLEKQLRRVQSQYKIDFTVVNGENADGVGLLPEQAWRIYDAGADVVTLGNHTFGRMQVHPLQVLQCVHCRQVLPAWTLLTAFPVR